MLHRLCNIPWVGWMIIIKEERPCHVVCVGTARSNHNRGHAIETITFISHQQQAATEWSSNTWMLWQATHKSQSLIPDLEVCRHISFNQSLHLQQSIRNIAVSLVGLTFQRKTQYFKENVDKQVSSWGFWLGKKNAFANTGLTMAHLSVSSSVLMVFEWKIRQNPDFPRFSRGQ